MLMRRWTLIFSFGWLLSTLASMLLDHPLALGQASSPRPNIVLLMADDQGWGETGYHGHPFVKTPVLDEMAATGLRLDRFYAGSSVCSPTRASVMTGRHANRSGVFSWNYSTRPEEITVAQLLRQAGYRTGHFGKWHLGAVKKESPVNPQRMGFEEYLSHDNFFELNPILSRNGDTPERIAGESSEVVMQAAIEFLKKAGSAAQPFFIVVWFGSPHGPYSGLESDLAHYHAVPKEEMRQRFAEITAMDRAIGQLRDALKSLELAENTLVWFNSDNGIPIADEQDSFNGGFRGRKGLIYEGGFLVPAVIEWPGVVTRPRQSSVPCVTSDILPTLLDLAQITYPDPDRPLDGISLRSLIVSAGMTERPSPIGFWKYDAKEESQNPRWIPADLSRGTTPTTSQSNIDFTNFVHPIAKTSDFGGEAAWTDNRYKLISRAHKSKPTILELYDLHTDPKETTDLADKHPAVVARMLAELQAWQASVERSLSGADYR
jgi:arylsulfatase A-like enzyme